MLHFFFPFLLGSLCFLFGKFDVDEFGERSKSIYCVDEGFSPHRLSFSFMSARFRFKAKKLEIKIQDLYP